MRFRVFCFLVFANAFLVFGSEERDKRMSMIAIGHYSGGCLITGNKLYINSFYDHDLTTDEQTEYTQYQAAVQIFLAQLEAYETQQREIWQNRFASQQNNWWNGNNQPASTTAGPSTTTLAPPTPPSRPSFCSDNVTTQYYFSGCTIQNNKVYVGNNFARNLTSNETNQLNVFIQQQQAFQNYVGEQFRQTFTILANKAASPNVSGNSTLNSTIPVGPPTPPNFCSTIYALQQPTPWVYDSNIAPVAVEDIGFLPKAVQNNVQIQPAVPVVSDF